MGLSDPGCLQLDQTSSVPGNSGRWLNTVCGWKRQPRRDFLIDPQVPSKWIFKPSSYWDTPDTPSLRTPTPRRRTWAKAAAELEPVKRSCSIHAFIHFASFVRRKSKKAMNFHGLSTSMGTPGKETSRLRSWRWPQIILECKFGTRSFGYTHF